MTQVALELRQLAVQTARLTLFLGASKVNRVPIFLS